MNKKWINNGYYIGCYSTLMIVWKAYVLIYLMFFHFKSLHIYINGQVNTSISN